MKKFMNARHAFAVGVALFTVVAIMPAATSRHTVCHPVFRQMQSSQHSEPPIYQPWGSQDGRMENSIPLEDASEGRAPYGVLTLTVPHW